MTNFVDYLRQKRAILLVSGVFGAVLPAHVAAEDLAAENADPAREIIVTAATRTEQSLDKVGQTVSVIDLAEIERRQTQNVADILRTIPGVTIARNGTIGGVASVFIRGAESDQTVALVDGVKLNDPSSVGGGFNFGNLMTGNIERIEVLRGSQSVLWGSQAIAGVVNMVTRRPTEELQVNARGEYGFRDTVNLVANASGKAGPLSASVGAGWFRTDGISNFAESRGGVERDGYENFGANANFNLAISEAISLDARGWYSRGTLNLDGFAPPTFAFGDVNEEGITRELVGYTGLNVALFDGRFRNRIGFALTDTKRRNTALDGPPAETFRGEGRNERLEYQGIVDIAKGWEVTFGLEQEISRFNSSSFGGPEARARARLYSGYAQVVGTITEGFTVTGGVRHDDHDRFGGATTFGASAVYNLAATGTTVRASYAEGFKVPSLFQLFSNFGNTTLQPERSQGWDAGITQSLVDGRLELSATYFQRDSEDLILFIGCRAPFTGICTNRPFGTYDNVGLARARGAEFAVTMRPTDSLSVQVTHGYVDSRNRAAGMANFDRRLPRRPENATSLLVDYRWPFGLETGFTLTNVSAAFENAANTLRLPGYTLGDIRAMMPLGKNLELTARIENLFDESYETALNFGQMPRAGYVGVRVKM
ncbi:TonB-dependent receptor [Erythrobacter sp. T5W1-R]|uniref:TonB-dependent receptor plug domain-containing protein n=1 Tax=Erythrobacter sp. T5W1-R TaxID=3101752 RepID=UPI002AFE0414|nr:TonB-dependent receptor [Erythrobacter sp. T5W1-R]MEA1618082.1 TonB-dependent receptor [Erythrobacter sp. T5W1-R]